MIGLMGEPTTVSKVAQACIYRFILQACLNRLRDPLGRDYKQYLHSLETVELQYQLNKFFVQNPFTLQSDFKYWTNNGLRVGPSTLFTILKKRYCIAVAIAKKKNIFRRIYGFMDPENPKKNSVCKCVYTRN